jgi:hypothetical protein
MTPMSHAIHLDELAAGLTRRGASLSIESAIFIVFEAMEALGARSAVINPGDVSLSLDGAVRLRAKLEAAHDEASVLEGAVETLEAVLDPAPMALSELAVKVRSAQIISRGALLSELAAMLVPLNRRAAQRMVARLVRECVRPGSGPALASTAPADAAETAHDGLVAASLTTQSEAVANDTVVDGQTLAARRDALATDLGGRLPAGWDDDVDTAERDAMERRKAWVAMAVAAVALVAAVVFLVERVRGANA